MTAPQWDPDDDPFDPNWEEPDDDSGYLDEEEDNDEDEDDDRDEEEDEDEFENEDEDDDEVMT